MIGLELRDSGVLAVAVGDDGRVSARASSAGSDLSAAALAALGQIPVSEIASPAVAAVNPESPGAAAAMKALAMRFDGSLAQTVPAASGTAAAMAEAWVGAAAGCGDVVYFAVADHAYAGILCGGRPMTGVNRRAPAAGWLSLNPVEREDYRKVGCLEAEVAAPGVVRRFIWRIKAGDRSRVQEVVGGSLTAVTLDHILEAARGGDGVSISVMRDTAKYLGMAAANLVAVADPEILVLGGIMASAADLLLEPVCAEVARHLPTPMAEALKITPATLGAEAAAIGAARLVAARP